MVLSKPTASDISVNIEINVEGADNINNYIHVIGETDGATSHSDSCDDEDCKHKTIDDYQNKTSEDCPTSTLQDDNKTASSQPEGEFISSSLPYVIQFRISSLILISLSPR